MIDHLAVVIPAHNEAAEIAGGIDAVLTAAARATSAMPHLDVRIVAVADACTDDTLPIIERLARAHPIITPLAVPFGNVGSSRDAAGRLALRDGADTLASRDAAGRLASRDAAGGLAPRDAAGPRTWRDAGDGDRRTFDRTWIAFTDADSRVPANWITAHLAHAESGADCLVGTVEPRAEADNEDLVAAWYAAHRLGEGHDHVFGANLGVRGSVFDDIGGCPRIAVGEDVALVAAVLAAGGDVHRTDDCRVVTSARVHGRCHGGFSTYLQGLVRASSAPSTAGATTGSR